MAVCEIHTTANNALMKMSAFYAILPEKMQGPFPVLYLLHGLSDDHSGWVRRTSIERHVQNLPLIVIMPDGGRGWYADSKSNPRMAYETFITQDLIEFVDSTFQTRAERAGRAVAGLSMGGYGAFKLALQHPDLFCAAVSFSGAVDMRYRMEQNPVWSAEFRAIFGDEFAGSREDIIALLEQVPADQRPALWMSTGDQDGLLEDNRRAHAHMERLGIPHFYREDPGYGHGWDYWDFAVQDALVFLADQLSIGR
jgi:putative tributyrin esterase